MSEQEQERPLTRREMRLREQAAAEAAVDAGETTEFEAVPAVVAPVNHASQSDVEIEISPLNDDGTVRTRREIRALREAALLELQGDAVEAAEAEVDTEAETEAETVEVSDVDADANTSAGASEDAYVEDDFDGPPTEAFSIAELLEAAQPTTPTGDAEAVAALFADVEVDEADESEAETVADVADDADSVPDAADDESVALEEVADEGDSELDDVDVDVDVDIDVETEDEDELEIEDVEVLFVDEVVAEEVVIDEDVDAADDDADAADAADDDADGDDDAEDEPDVRVVVDEVVENAADDEDDAIESDAVDADEAAETEDALEESDDLQTSDVSTPPSGYSFPDIQPPEEWRSVFDDPSRLNSVKPQNGTGDFDDLISRAVAQEGSTGATGVSALILPTHPGDTGGLTGPLGVTGELFVTGSIELPKSIGETGGHASLLDSVETNEFLTGEQTGAISAVVDSGPTPVSALSAVSARRRPEIPVVAEPTKDKSRMPIILALSGGGLLIIISGAVILAATQGWFG